MRKKYSRRGEYRIARDSIESNWCISSGQAFVRSRKNSKPSTAEVIADVCLACGGLEKWHKR